MTEARTTNMPSRRAVTKAAAWSAPVIAAAVAAPMAAASGGGNSKNGHLFWNPQISTSKQEYKISGPNVLRIWADTPGGKAYKPGDQWTIDLSASNLTFSDPAGTTYTTLGSPYSVTVTIVDSTHAYVIINTGFSYTSSPNYTDVTFSSTFFTATPTGTFSGKITIAPTTDNSLSDSNQVNNSVP